MTVIINPDELYRDEIYLPSKSSALRNFEYNKNRYRVEVSTSTSSVAASTDSRAVALGEN